MIVMPDTFNFFFALFFLLLIIFKKITVNGCSELFCIYGYRKRAHTIQWPKNETVEANFVTVFLIVCIYA